MLRTAATKVLIRLSSQYEQDGKFRLADRAEALARRVMAAAHDHLDDATFDYLYGLSDVKPQYEWQTPSPDDPPAPDSPVVTREQLNGLAAADGNPAQAVPYQQNATWAQTYGVQPTAQQPFQQQSMPFTPEPAKSGFPAHKPFSQRDNQEFDGTQFVPRDEHGSPRPNVLKTRGHDGSYDGNFLTIDEIKRLIGQEEGRPTPINRNKHHSAPAQQSMAA
jgi:hypothetical protein